MIFMRAAKKIFLIFGNKYVIALSIFAAIILFTDHNNLFEQWDRKQELKKLQIKKAYYEEEIEKTKRKLADLSNNAAALEKFAREKFYMKRDNEDIFVVDSIKVSKK
jgi:cell division protein DivIC